MSAIQFYKVFENDFQTFRKIDGNNTSSQARKRETNSCPQTSWKGQKFQQQVIHQFGKHLSTGQSAKSWGGRGNTEMATAQISAALQTRGGQQGFHTSGPQGVKNWDKGAKHVRAQRWGRGPDSKWDGSRTWGQGRWHRKDL